MVPLSSTQHRDNSFIDLLDRYILPKHIDTDMFLGVIIMPKRFPPPVQFPPEIVSPPKQNAAQAPTPIVPPPTQNAAQALAQISPTTQQQNIATNVANLLDSLRNPAMLQMLSNSIRNPAPVSPPTPSPTTLVPNPMSGSMPPPNFQVMPSSLPPFAGTLHPSQMSPFPPHGSPHIAHNSPGAYIPSASAGASVGARPSPPVHPSRLARISGSSPPGANQHPTPPPTYPELYTMPPQGGPASGMNNNYDRRFSQGRPSPGRGQSRARGQGGRY
jgi:hypothetical protein